MSWGKSMLGRAGAEAEMEASRAGQGRDTGREKQRGSQAEPEGEEAGGQTEGGRKEDIHREKDRARGTDTETQRHRDAH